MSERDDLDEYGDAEYEHFYEIFGPDITADIVVEFMAFLDDHAPDAKKSQPRAVICDSLLTMEDYRVDCNREQMGLSELLDGFTPPAGWPAWGKYGKPKTMFHQPPRMEAAGLVMLLMEEKIGPGRPIYGVELTPEGAIYAYKHGTATLADVVNYWRWERGERNQDTTNQWLQRREPQEQMDFRFTTPGNWYLSLLETLQLDDLTFQRYRDTSASDLGHLLTAVHTTDGRGAYRKLKAADRGAIVGHVLKELGHREVGLDMMANTIGAKKIAAQVDSLVDLHLYARPASSAPDDTHDDVLEASRKAAEEVINELICRVAWVIVRKVMDHRINDPVTVASRAGPKVVKPPLSTITLDLGDWQKMFKENESISRAMKELQKEAARHQAAMKKARLSLPGTTGKPRTKKV